MNSLAIVNLLRLELNKINSNLYQDLLNEELEDFFNQQQEEYISSIFSLSNKDKTGFEMSEKRIRDLQNLVVEDYVDIFYNETNDTTSLKYRTAIPNDYKWHIASSIQSYYSPSGNITFSLNQVSSTIALLPFTPGDIINFSGFNLQRTTDSSTIFASRSQFVNYNYPNNLRAFIDFLIPSYDNQQFTVPNPKNYELYWENYQGQYYPNTLIIVRLASNVPSIKYSFDGTTFTTLNWQTVLNYVPTGFSGGVTKTSATMFRSHDKAKALNSHKASQTDVREPILTISAGKFNIWTDGTFIPQKLILDYIRKPKHISLKLQQDCELPDNVVYEIIAKCVTHICAQTNPASYQINQNEEFKTS